MERKTNETAIKEKLSRLIEAFCPILYEDEDLLVLNKPANMPVHPSMNHHKGTLANGILYYYKQLISLDFILNVISCLRVISGSNFVSFK